MSEKPKTAADAPAMAREALEKTRKVNANRWRVACYALERIAALPPAAQLELCDHQKAARELREKAKRDHFERFIGRDPQPEPNSEDDAEAYRLDTFALIQDLYAALRHIENTPCAGLAGAERARLARYEALRAKYAGLEAGKGSIPADHHELAKDLAAIDPVTELEPLSGNERPRLAKDALDAISPDAIERIEKWFHDPCAAEMAVARVWLRALRKIAAIDPATEPAPRMVPLDELCDLIESAEIGEGSSRWAYRSALIADLRARFGQREGGKR